jgi:hypothetical protein
MMTFCRLYSRPFYEGNTTWQQSTVYDDGPRTAPITTPRSGFPFNSKPVSTVTPERKRQHVRSPSEGVFNLSMDEDSALSSPSDASGGLKTQGSLPNSSSHCFGSLGQQKRLLG